MSELAQCEIFEIFAAVPVTDWGADNQRDIINFYGPVFASSKFFPYSGKLRVSFGEARQLVIGHHLAIYRIEEERIVVLADCS